MTLTEEQLEQRRQAGKASAQKRKEKKLALVQDQLKEEEVQVEVPVVAEIKEEPPLVKPERKQHVKISKSSSEPIANTLPSVSLEELEEFVTLLCNQIIDERINEFKQTPIKSNEIIEKASEGSSKLLPLLIPLFIQFVTNSGLLTALSEKILNVGEVKKKLSNGDSDLNAFFGKL